MGHALFMLEDPDNVSEKLSQTDYFFNNLIEDTVIDSRLRRFPALEQPMADLYQQVMGEEINNLATAPLSSQLMYGIRIGQVLGLQPAVDGRVNQMINSLRRHDINGQVFDIIDTMTQPNTSLAQMRQIAERFIKPLYNELLEQDHQDGRDGDIQQAIDNYEQSHGIHGLTEQDEDNADDKTSQSKPLPEQIKKAIEETTEDTKENSDDGDNSGENSNSERDSDGTSDENSNERLTAESSDRDDKAAHPTAEELAEIVGSLAKEMNLSLSDAEGYLRMALEHQSIILGVAEVFKQLARPAASTQRMTNIRGRHHDGATLHTDATPDLALQETNSLPAEAIWQRIDRRTTRQSLDFSGLDIHLLVDVSASMKGDSAHCATAAAVCLLEGLNLAKAQIARENSYQMPDVRTHVVAFGSTAVELSPLNHQTNPVNLGRMYHALMNPDSWSTRVGNAIKMSQTPPERDGISLIVSDGQFFDEDEAESAVNQQPENHYIGQFVIGSSGSPITENYHKLSDPYMLPSTLLSVLQNYLRRCL